MFSKLHSKTFVVIPLALIGGLAVGSTALAATGSDDAMSSDSGVTDTSPAGSQTAKDYANGENTAPEKSAGDSTADNSMSSGNSMSTGDDMSSDQMSDKGTKTGEEYEEGGNQNGESGM